MKYRATYWLDPGGEDNQHTGPWCNTYDEAEASVPDSPEAGRGSILWSVINREGEQREY
jgi:hypothetical protein